MQIHKITTIGISLIALLPAAFAEGFYADGGYSFTTVNNQDLLDSLNDAEYESLAARFGYEVATNISIEGEAIIGLTGYSESGSGFRPVPGADPNERRPFTFRNESSLDFILGGYARATLPVTSRLDVFGRLGYATTEIDSKLTMLESDPDPDEDPFEILNSRTTTSSGPAFGVGATFDVTEKIYIRADLTRYDLDYDELDNITIGAGIRF